MDELSSIPFDVLTPAALLGLAILLILRGYLVPRAQVDRLMGDRDAQIAEKNLQLQNKDEKLKVLLEHNSLLLRGNETTLHLVESLPDVIRRIESLTHQPQFQPLPPGGQTP